MLVRLRAREPLLHIAQPAADVAARRRARAQRDRVDAKPDEPLRAGQFRRPAGHRHAVDDLRHVRPPREQPRPRGEHGNGRRYAMTPRGVLQRAARGRLEPQIARHVVAARRRVPPDVADERRRLREPGERRAPERVVARPPGAPEVLDERRVARRGRQRGRAPPQARRMQRLQFAEQDARRPSVENQMVMADDHQVARGRAAYHRDAQQRRPGRIETPLAVRAQVRVEPRVECVARVVPAEIRPVEPFERHARAAQHDLPRLVAPLPKKRGAQALMPVDEVRPCGGERLRVERAVEFGDELLEEHGRRRIEQAVEQHAVLHRRERQHRFDRRRGGPLAGGESKVRRRSACRHRSARLHQCPSNVKKTRSPIASMRSAACSASRIRAPTSAAAGSWTIDR